MWHHTTTPYNNGHAMPITQARLKTILDSLENSIKYYRVTAKNALATCQHVRAGTATLEDIEQLFIGYDEFCSRDELILRTELLQYHHTHKRNDYERRRRQLLSGKSDFVPLNRLTATTATPSPEPLAPPRFTASEQSAILDRLLGTPTHPPPPPPPNTYDGTTQITYQDSAIIVESDPPPDFDGDQAFGAPTPTENDGAN